MSSPSLYPASDTHNESASGAKTILPRFATPSQNVANDTPPDDTQRLIFVFQEAEQKFDERNVLFSKDVRDMSVDQFFYLHSISTHISPETASYLTFSLLFGEDETMVVERGDTEQWKILKRMTAFSFKLYSKKNKDEEEFYVAVEGGFAHNTAGHR